MVKPETFQKPCVALRHVPYLFEENSPTGGVLGRGQTVWVQNDCDPQKAPHAARAFVENVGVVSLDPRWLVSADALKH